MNVGDLIEHINKESTSGYPHDKIYTYEGSCRVKDPTTREWVDGVIYSHIEGNTKHIFVRELSDFKEHFKIHHIELKL